MASIAIIGFIDKVKYLPDSAIVFVSEYRRGYKRKDGSYVDEKYIQWKTVWKPYFKNYINNHFNTGMLVEIHGDVLPYAIEHEKIIEGYSILGKTIDLFSYPRSMAKQEKKMIKESQLHSMGEPNLDDYNAPDF